MRICARRPASRERAARHAPASTAGLTGARAAGSEGLGGVRAGTLGGLVLLRFGLALLGRGFRPAVLEVGRVPAGALQLEARCAHQLVKGALATLRALGQRLVAHALQHFLLVPARAATVFVD